MGPRAKRLSVALSAFIVGVLWAAASPAATIPTPEETFGFRPGADRELIDYGQLIAYLEKVAAASDRLTLQKVGATPMGKPMYVAFVSAPENLARLDELKALNRRLALEPDIPDAEREELVRTGRVFVMATLSMHSTEVAPSQSLPLFAYEMATTDDPAVLERLSQVVLMVVPNHNPDGMDMVVSHYRKYKGTEYEGSSMPGVYHKYVGHDNNRDFVTLTQEDTRVISHLYSTEWFPQVLVEKHQMGRTGPRYFVPVNHDPIAEVIDEGLYNWMGVFGAGLSKDMGAVGLQGVVSHWAFDDYWPGSTETSLWKNVISFLTEAAGCKVATPIFVEPTELRVSGKGLAEYKKGVNMPDPWPGGWWHLGDIVHYELVSLHSILATAASQREEILRFRNDLCRKEVGEGQTVPPYYFVLPQEQHDRGALPRLVRLLQEHGVVVSRLTADATIEGRAFRQGDVVVSMSQPYRAFVKEVMEAQEYPERHYMPGGEVIEPYDITSWSLPLHHGLRSYEIESRVPDLRPLLEALPEGWSGSAQPATLPEQLWGVAYPATDNESFRAAFLALEKGLKVSRLEAAAEVGGRALPKGSFLIEDGHGEALEAVAKAATTAPIVMAESPSAATSPLRLPRIGLVETWFHDMDAGWTRFIFDSYHIPYRLLHPGDVGGIDLAKELDVLVFPDASKDVLLKGKRKRGDGYWPTDYPPEYTKAIGDEGTQRILAFLEAGGEIVSWRGSTALFLDGLSAKDGSGSQQSLDLPASDISERLEKAGLSVPGSLLRIELLEDHPLTYGMPAEIGVFSRGEPVFQTSIPILDTDRRVIAKYPEKDILMSGYAAGEEQLANQPVMVWLRKGKGQLVLFGFNPQFRASTPVSYKLLFNALLLPKLS
jgi:hypothetical protein